jgi:hypothetical protein
MLNNLRIKLLNLTILLDTRIDVKDYIVICISAMCVKSINTLKSGWSIIINIFTLAAQDSEPAMVDKSFNALKYAVTTKFQLLEESFVELVNCLNKYSKNVFPKQSIEAI